MRSIYSHTTTSFTHSSKFFLLIFGSGASIAPTKNLMSCRVSFTGNKKVKSLGIYFDAVVRYVRILSFRENTLCSKNCIGQYVADYLQARCVCELVMLDWAIVEVPSIIASSVKYHTHNRQINNQ